MSYNLEICLVNLKGHELLFHSQKTNKAANNIKKFNKIKGKFYNFVKPNYPNLYGVLPLMLLPWKSLTCTQDHKYYIFFKCWHQNVYKNSNIYDIEWCRRSTNVIVGTSKFDFSTSKILSLNLIHKCRSLKQFNQGTNNSAWLVRSLAVPIWDSLQCIYVPHNKLKSMLNWETCHAYHWWLRK